MFDSIPPDCYFYLGLENGRFFRLIRFIFSLKFSLTMYPRLLLPLLVCLFLLPRFSAAQSAPRDTAEVNRVIDSLLQVSGTLTKLRQYDQALEMNAEAERLALGYLGRESVGYGKVCYWNGLIALYQNDFVTAERLWVLQKDINEKIFGKNHISYANSLSNLANLYSVLSDFTKSENYYLEAKIIVEKKHGKDHPTYAEIAHNLALLYRNIGDYVKSESFFLEAKEIRKRVLGEENESYINTIEGLANMYSDIGRYNEAQSFYLDVARFRKKILGEAHPNYAGSLINLGTFLQDLGVYDTAEYYLVKGKEIFELPPNNRMHIFYVSSTNSLGILYERIGLYEKAEKYYHISLDVLKKIYGIKNVNYAGGIINLAILYRKMGQYEKVEPLYLKAKHIFEVMLNNTEHPFYNNCLLNLGAFYYTLGIYEKAELLFLEVKALNEKVFGKEHPNYALSLYNLGTLYDDMGQYEKAEPLYIEAKAIQEKALGKEHHDYAMILNNLANLYSHMGQYEKVKPLYFESLAIMEKVLGKEHPDYAVSLHNMAILYKDMGQYEISTPLHLEAKAICEKALGKEHPDYVQSLNNLTKLYELQSLHPSSDSLLAEFHPLQQSRQSQAITYLSERDLTAYAATFQSDGDELASYASNRLAKGHSTTILPTLYYNHQLFQKGFLLGAASRVGALAAAAPESEETFNRLKGYRRRLAAEYAKPIAERKNVPELEAKADSLEKTLVRTVAGFGEALRQVNWQEVQATLKPGEAAVEFVHYRYYDPKARATDSTLYAALVLLPADTAPRFVPLCEARQIEAAVQKAGTDELRFQKMYNVLEGQPVSPLYPLVWQPLEAHLQGIKTVYYAPSGLLHRLQLGAIQPTKRETLSDRYRLVALGSTRQLVVPPAVSPAGNTAAVFGGIRYEMDSTKIAAVNLAYADTSAALADVFRGSGGFVYTDSTLRGGGWQYLPATEAEATNISGLLKKHGFRTDTRLGFAATEESVQHLGSGKSPSPRVLHIATHGFFFPDPKATGAGRQAMDNEPTFKISDNPLIRSGLLLAGAEHGWKTGKPLREGMEDGILTAYEISQMNLRNTELVVLSACETGLGDIQGNEGVYGLQRAFKVAGARYLLMSLWQVPDKETQAFMESFYAHWLDKGMSIPDAFRAAQGVARAGNANPLYWAGFVLVE